MLFRKIVAVLIVFVSATLFAQEVKTSPQFQRLDENRDDKLTKEEVPPRLFERLDTDKDGVITAKEDQEFVRRNRQGQEVRVPESVETHRDIAYANTGNPRQRLNLYLPKKRSSDKPLPVVAFIHGGGWRNGDKRGGYRQIAALVESGEYAGVSIGYRLSGEAIWPAQIYDPSDAIPNRLLRRNPTGNHTAGAWLSDWKFQNGRIVDPVSGQPIHMGRFWRGHDEGIPHSCTSFLGEILKRR